MGMDMSGESERPLGTVVRRWVADVGRGRVIEQRYTWKLTAGGGSPHGDLRWEQEERQEDESGLPPDWVHVQWLSEPLGRAWMAKGRATRVEALKLLRIGLQQRWHDQVKELATVQTHIADVNAQLAPIETMSTEYVQELEQDAEVEL